MTTSDWENMVLGSEEELEKLYLSKHVSEEELSKTLVNVVGTEFKGGRAFTVMEVSDHIYKKLLAFGTQNKHSSTAKQVALLHSCGRYVGQIQSSPRLFLFILDKVTIVGN
jgi:prolyl-tRNA editing enzyme YbaK/EbsC (Cys-tRNA(Pro) deacylase)